MPAREEEEREQRPHPESALYDDNENVFKDGPAIAVLAETPLSQNLTVEIDIMNSGQQGDPATRDDKVRSDATGPEGEGDKRVPHASEPTIPDRLIKVASTDRRESGETIG